MAFESRAKPFYVSPELGEFQVMNHPSRVRVTKIALEMAWSGHFSKVVQKFPKKMWGDIGHVLLMI